MTKPETAKKSYYAENCQLRSASASYGVLGTLHIKKAGAEAGRDLYSVCRGLPSLTPHSSSRCVSGTESGE